MQLSWRTAMVVDLEDMMDYWSTTPSTQWIAGKDSLKDTRWSPEFFREHRDWIGFDNPSTPLNNEDAFWSGPKFGTEKGWHLGNGEAYYSERDFMYPTSGWDVLVNTGSKTPEIVFVTPSFRGTTEQALELAGLLEKIPNPKSRDKITYKRLKAGK